MPDIHSFSARERQDAFRPGHSQAQLLHSQSAVTCVFPLIAAAAICLLLWDISSRPVLLGWAALVSLYSVGRYALLRRFRPPDGPGAEIDQWRRAFAGGVVLSGCLWGAAPIVLIAYQPARLVEFTLYNGLIVLVISGLVAGAVLAYGVSLLVLLCYVVPALLPPALYLIHLGDRYNSALGGFVLLYLLFIAASSLLVRERLMHYMRVEHEYLLARREIEELQRCVRPRGDGPESTLLYQAHFPPR